MNGLGILQGLGVTLKRFIDTYTDEIRLHGKKYFNEEGISARSRSDTRGIFTIQYPEEKLPVPEEFRYIPMLLYEEDENGEKQIRCTACGICAKVCPTQCIWIVKDRDPETGKPTSKPAEFSIDVDICMNCGLCAEFCPFDSIKMDHEYEIAEYNRFDHHIFGLEKLLKPVSYYAKIRPLNYAKEEAEREAKAAAKAVKNAG